MGFSIINFINHPAIGATRTAPPVYIQAMAPSGSKLKLLVIPQGPQDPQDGPSTKSGWEMWWLHQGKGWLHRRVRKNLRVYGGNTWFMIATCLTSPSEI